MSNEKFTQGEWLVYVDGVDDEDFTENDSIVIGLDSYNDNPCWNFTSHKITIETTEDEAVANAHLIAAAPNGFQLGLLVMELCGHPSGISEQQADLLYETALSFIKKARGGKNN